MISVRYGRHVVAVIHTAGAPRSSHAQLARELCQSEDDQLKILHLQPPITKYEEEIFLAEKLWVGTSWALRLCVLYWSDPKVHLYIEWIRWHWPGAVIVLLCQDHQREKIRGFFDSALLGEVVCMTSSGEPGWLSSRILQLLERDLAERYETPYWDSLRKFSTNIPANFHALPVGNSHSLSHLMDDFWEVFGAKHFASETSLSHAPLDSLLKPVNAIRKAQQKAAKAFGASLGLEHIPGAWGTRFVTNGTSTANAIVLDAFVNDQNWVLLDRAAHVSHFHALARIGARVEFLAPFINSLGLAGPTPLQELQEKLEYLLVEREVIPAMIILTNPTIDGLAVRPQSVITAVCEVVQQFWSKYKHTQRIKRLLQNSGRYYGDFRTMPINDSGMFVREVFQRMVFLFDEAWSAVTRFHPGLIDYTAMHGAWAAVRSNETAFLLDSLRMYSTQSIHKSLSAFRQGSMLHYRDPLMADRRVQGHFEQAYYGHATTSPNATILASLDVARRQAELEGFELLCRCTRLARGFREKLSSLAGGGAEREEYPFVPDATDMLKPIRRGTRLDEKHYGLIPTHVTIAWHHAVSGAEVRRRLLDRGIQVNKYDAHSVLAIFNIGINEKLVENLYSAVTELFSPRQRKGARQTVDSADVLDVRQPLERKTIGDWLFNRQGRRAELLSLDEMSAILENRPGESLVSAVFVVPYPPGYPLLVPGQPIGSSHLDYLRERDAQSVLGASRVDHQFQLMVYRL